MRLRVLWFVSLASALVVPACADPFFFSTGSIDGKMAAASRPDSAGKFEIETGDDFVLGSHTVLNSATFVGLLTGGATVADIGEVRVEIYRIFPTDSVNPPSGKVPTRTNSPSDVEFTDRDTASANLSFTTSLLSSFAALNSVLPGGIHPKPGQTTGGNGSVTGEEVQFDVTFTTPLDLPEDHYFFVPQVEVTTPDGEFMWLSAPRPIVSGTPFPPGLTDLQAWTRDAALDPDWLRIGTDIVGGDTPPTFNMTFSLSGETVPEPSSYILLGSALLAFAAAGRKKLRKG